MAQGEWAPGSSLLPARIVVTLNPNGTPRAAYTAYHVVSPLGKIIGEFSTTLSGLPGGTEVVTAAVIAALENEALPMVDLSLPVAAWPVGANLSQPPDTSPPPPPAPEPGPEPGTPPPPTIQLPSPSLFLSASGLSLTADASGSVAGTNPITGYTFDFGDGANSGELTNPSATHVYAQDGSYLVTVTVTDTEGLTASVATLTSVSATQPTGPTAVLSVSASGLTATADASASTAGDAAINLWDYRWGDGVEDTGTDTATHDYTDAGTYTVTLTVGDSNGLTSVATADVTVS